MKTLKPHGATDCHLPFVGNIYMLDQICNICNILKLAEPINIINTPYKLCIASQTYNSILLKANVLMILSKYSIHSN